MKKQFFAMALIAAAFVSVANAATVVSNNSLKGNTVLAAAPPAAVLRSFISLFGTVPVKEWKQRSNSQWRAHFIKGGRAWEATFSGTGALVKSEPA